MPLAPLPPVLIEPIVRAALIEDLGRAGDITTDAIVPSDVRAQVSLAARQAGVVAGLDLALMTFRLIDPAIAASVIRVDGSPVAAGEGARHRHPQDASRPARATKVCQPPRDGSVYLATVV
jgi:nicotinate-nucleotide pyrophosphorylase (carboxylating)